MERQTARATGLRVLWAVVALGALVGCAAGGGASSESAVATTSASARTQEPSPASVAALAPKGELDGPFPVTKVVDGDTIWVRVGGDRAKVRLIGIDTAETVAPGEPVGCFGPEATEEAQRLLTGTSVFLERDPTQGDYDAYDRLLAYAWLDDGRLFNLEMIRGGYAIEYTYDDPYAYQAEFRAAQTEAEDTQAGMWSPQTCGGAIAFAS